MFVTGGDIMWMLGAVVKMTGLLLLLMLKVRPCTTVLSPSAMAVAQPVAVCAVDVL